jgi:hypothetical protein
MESLARPFAPQDKAASSANEIAQQALRQAEAEPARPLSDRQLTVEFSWGRFFKLFICGIVPGIIYLIHWCMYNNLDEFAKTSIQDVHNAIWTNVDPKRYLSVAAQKLAETRDKVERVAWWLAADHQPVVMSVKYAMLKYESELSDPTMKNAFNEAHEALEPCTDVENRNKARQFLDELIALKPPRPPEDLAEEIVHPSRPSLPPLELPPNSNPIPFNDELLPVVEPERPQSPIDRSLAEMEAQCPKTAGFFRSLSRVARVESASFDETTGKFTLEFDQDYVLHLSSLADAQQNKFGAKPALEGTHLTFPKKLSGNVVREGQDEVFTPEGGLQASTGIKIPFVGLTRPSTTLSSIKFLHSDVEMSTAMGAQKAPLESFFKVLSNSYLIPARLSPSYNPARAPEPYKLGG